MFFSFVLDVYSLLLRNKTGKKESSHKNENFYAKKTGFMTAYIKLIKIKNLFIFFEFGKTITKFTYIFIFIRK